MHPIIRLLSLLVFIAVLALGAPAGLPAGLFLLLLLYGLGGRAHLAGLLGLVRGIRWLLLSILVLYSWWTPGTALWTGLGAYGPTLEGLAQGGVRAGVLLAIVAAVHWVMSTTDRSELLAAVVALTRPLRWLGLNHERLAVRILLTLETVPEVRALTTRIRQAGAGEGTRLARLAGRARQLYGAVLDQADSVEPGIREVPDTGRVPAWQWAIPLLLGLFLWLGSTLSFGFHR